MSSDTLQITIRVANRLDVALSFVQVIATAGATPTASAAMVAPGSTLNIVASGRGHCAGSFVLAADGTEALVAYAFLSSDGTALVAALSSPGLVWGTDEPVYPGRSVTASLNLYDGVASGSLGGYAVPLGLLAWPTYDDGQDFANSMYGVGMRSAAQIATAYRAAGADGYIIPADFTGGQLGGLVAAWMDYWLDIGGNTINWQDAALLDLLRRYVAKASPAGALSLWLPDLDYETGSAPAVYTLNGYLELPLIDGGGAWRPTAVSTLLTRLVAGAHFVAVSANDDLPEGVTSASFDETLQSSGLPTRHDIGNSHYTTVLNITGTYYLSVTTDFAPPGCGLLLAFLTARTVNDPLLPAGSYNSFIQLEGWQSTVGSRRHSADFDVFKQTLWNISTYGACPYSEKRGTSLFLAPPGWVPAVYQTTRMAPYVGAYATDPSDPQPQPWLVTTLIRIPNDVPPLPARYFTGS